MFSNQSTLRIGFKSSATWAAAAITSLGFMFGSPAALAVAPPANTVIGNQASASYSDTSGNIQLATSNLVQTTVQQVGSFNLDTVSQLSPTTVVNTKTGAAGATVYAPHTLTNTGNGTDTFSIKVAGSTLFSKVEVYSDLTGVGVPDSTTPLCSSVSSVACIVPAQSIAAGGAFTFVVAYSIPSSAVTPSTPFDSAVISVTPTTTALYTAPNDLVSDKDNVNLTTGAAFNMTKAIGAPLVTAPGNGAWPVALTGGQATVPSATCSTIWTPGMTSSATCTYTVYTLTFGNSGAAAGAFVLTDALPAGLTYVAGSAVWSNKPGVALANTGGVSQSGIDFSVTAGGEIDAVVASIAPNVTQTLSFVVLVNSSATVGNGATTNIAKYSATSPATTPKGPGITIIDPSVTNPSIFTVLQRFGIAVGSSASTAATALDSNAGSGNGAADLSLQPSVVAGGSVKFMQSVFNTGNGSDSVNLVAVNGAAAFPAGTTFSFFAADGVSPLLDTNGDGIPDTGPIAAGAVVSIVIQATVPSSAIVNSGPFNLVVTGKSTGDTTKIDATIDTVSRVIGSLVDITNTAAGTGAGAVADGDLGPGPSPLPTTTNVTPAGTGTVFNLFVKNNDTVGNTYNLSASQTTGFPGTLPAGWTVKYVVAGGTCASAAISQPITVGAGAQVEVDACVTPPATQVAQKSQKIYFQVQSAATASNGVIVRDAITDAVTVTTASTHGAVLTPNNSGQIAPGGTVAYPHALINTGNQSCGAYTLAATLSPADVTAGWTATIYLDNNNTGVIDAGDTLATGTQSGLAVGATQNLLVKVFAPGAGAAGATDLVTLTATFTAGECGQVSVTDTSTVVTGQIRVVKAQALDVGCTGLASAFSARHVRGQAGPVP